MGNFPLQLKGVRKTFRDGDKEIEILHSLSFQAKKVNLSLSWGHQVLEKALSFRLPVRF